MKGWEEAVRNLTVKLVPAPAANVEELEHAFVLMKHAHARGVVITGDPLFYANRRRVNELAVRHGLAVSWLYREGPDAGGAGPNTSVAAYGPFVLGQHIGFETVQTVLTLGHGQDRDTFAGPFAVELTNLVGQVLFAASGTVAGKRLEIEALTTP